jgi:hypothetical protein
LADKKIRSTIIVDPDIWKEVRIESIRRDMEISQFVELALRKELVSSLDERRAKIGEVKNLDKGIDKTIREQITNQSQQQLSQQIQEKEREQLQQSPYFSVFESDTVEPEPGGQSIEVSINMPGIKFPINKIELVDFAVYLDYVFSYTRTAAEGFYYPLFRDLPDKTYTNKDQLGEALQIMLDTSKKGFFGKRRKVVGVSLFTTREEIERNNIESHKRQISEYYKEVEKFYKGLDKEQKEKLIEERKRYQEKQIQETKRIEEFLEQDKKEWQQKHREERGLERKEYEFDKIS